MMNKFKPAFSLGEVLITLIIIGVIAALTIPMLVGNYQEQANRAKLKKSYSMLQSAFEMVKDFDNIDYATTSSFVNADLDVVTPIIDKLKKYLLVSKDCGHSTGCAAKIYYYKNRALWTKKFGKSSPEDYAVTLNDGTTVVFTMFVKNTILNKYKLGIDKNLLYNSNFVAMVDINGASGPNTISKDVFFFVLTKEGLLPAGTSNKSANCELRTEPTDGTDCAAKYIFDEDKK